MKQRILHGQECADAAAVAEAAANVPLGRIGRPHELAALVAYLTPDSGFATGAVFDINGLAYGIASDQKSFHESVLIQI